MTEAREKCSYCGHRNAGNEGAKCHMCKMGLGDDYIVFIGTDAERVMLCSIECLDLFEESKDMEGE